MSVVCMYAVCCKFGKMNVLTLDLEKFLKVPSTHTVAMLSADHPTCAIEQDKKSVGMLPAGISKQSVIQKSMDVEISPGLAEYTYWPRNVTIRLIEEYKEHHKKVGGSIRNFKKLFEMIATILNKTFDLNLTGPQVNNKYKTLERGYKNVIDNNNKTGRGRKFFEYEKEMDSIFGKLTKINPEILLSETSIAKIPTTLQKGTLQLSVTSASETLQERKSKDVVNINDPGNVNNGKYEGINSQNKEPARKLRTKKTRNDVLELIRQDRLEYQKKQISIATEKLAVEVEKLKEHKRRNDLLEEKNQLLKIYIQNFEQL